MGFEEECFRESVDEMIDSALESKDPWMSGISRRRLEAGQVRLNFGSSVAAELRSAGQPGAPPPHHPKTARDGDLGAVPVQDGVNYSIDTVRRLKRTLKKSDRLFFLIGIDAFRDVAKWRETRALLAECDFIVASRPGYSLRDVAESLPEDLRPPAAVTRPFHKQPAKGDLVLPGVTLHLLEGVNQSVSATAIRAVAAQGKPLGRWLDPRVADYIRKHGLYRGERLEK